MAVSAASVVRGPGEIAAMVVDVTRRIFTTRALVTVVDTPDGWLVDQIDTQ